MKKHNKSKFKRINRGNILNNQQVDIQTIDIAKPIEPKKFTLDKETIIKILIIQVIVLAIKLILFDNFLFNTELELDLVQRNLAQTFAKLTHVPEVNIDYQQIDTSSPMALLVQLLEQFVVNPVMSKVENVILSELDKAFSMVDSGLGKLQL